MGTDRTAKAKKTKREGKEKQEDWVTEEKNQIKMT